MDTLHFATAVGREFGIEVAEAEYTELASLAKARAYVERKLASRP
jgi:acyl carrier protein